jgi:hypothetical protein
MEWPSHTPIEELQLSVRSYNCLAEANIKTVGDIYKLPGIGVARIPGIGERSVREIKHALLRGASAHSDAVASGLREEVALWKGRYEGAMEALRLLNKVLPCPVEPDDRATPANPGDPGKVKADKT